MPREPLGPPAHGTEELELSDGAEILISEPHDPGLLDLVEGEVAVRERDGVVVATAVGPARVRRTRWLPAPSPAASLASSTTRLPPDLVHTVHDSAARSLRAAEALGIALSDLQSAAAAWAAVADATDAHALDELVAELFERPESSEGADLVADAEDSELIEAWLDDHGSGDHVLVGPLVARGLGPEWLDALARRLPGDRLAPALAHLGATLVAHSLVGDIAGAARQMSHLIAPARGSRGAGPCPQVMPPDETAR